jgi:hypothetical protein
MKDRILAFAVQATMLLVFFLVFAIAVLAISGITLAIIWLGAHADVVLGYFAQHFPR